jgi:hypothetical protein
LQARHSIEKIKRRVNTNNSAKYVHYSPLIVYHHFHRFRLASLFRAIDTDQNGFVDESEFTQAMKTLINLKDDDIQACMVSFLGRDQFRNLSTFRLF